MGSLKPGATYVYERDSGVTYAREIGAAPDTRFAIGWDYDPGESKRFDVRKDVSNGELADHNEWIKIRLAGKRNPTLQKAIENVKLIYRMVKDDQ